MEFVIRVLFLVVGFFIGSIGLSQIIIILMFSKKFTNHLEKQGYLLNAELIRKRENVTLIFWLITFPLVTLLIYTFASIGSFVFFASGAIISVILGHSRYGMTDTNQSEYYLNNAKLIDMDKLEKDLNEA